MTVKRMYEYADKIIKLINVKIVREFSAVRALTDFDEINVLKRVTAAYEEIYKAIVKYYYRLAKISYKDASGLKKSGVTKEFIALILAEPNAVSRYAFDGEFDRKRLRLAEAVTASGGDSLEISRAMRLLSSMTALYAVTVTDSATIHGYKDAGVKKVRWKSENDSKRCKVCGGLDGKIYDIDKAPPKPHINCRCWLEPVTEKGAKRR